MTDCCIPIATVIVATPGATVDVPIPRTTVRTMSQCPIVGRTFDRSEIPALHVVTTAQSVHQDLTGAIVTFALHDASATPKTAIATWDNDADSANPKLQLRQVERGQVWLAALVDFSSFTPPLPVGTRTLEYEVTIAFEGQRYKTTSGTFKVE